MKQTPSTPFEQAIHVLERRLARELMTRIPTMGRGELLAVESNAGAANDFSWLAGLRSALDEQGVRATIVHASIDPVRALERLGASREDAVYPSIVLVHGAEYLPLDESCMLFDHAPAVLVSSSAGRNHRNPGNLTGYARWHTRNRIADIVLPASIESLPVFTRVFAALGIPAPLGACARLDKVDEERLHPVLAAAMGGEPISVGREIFWLHGRCVLPADARMVLDGIEDMEQLLCAIAGTPDDASQSTAIAVAMAVARLAPGHHAGALGRMAAAAQRPGAFEERVRLAWSHVLEVAGATRAAADLVAGSTSPASRRRRAHVEWRSGRPASALAALGWTGGQAADAQTLALRAVIAHDSGRPAVARASLDGLKSLLNDASGEVFVNVLEFERGLNEGAFRTRSRPDSGLAPAVVERREDAALAASSPASRAAFKPLDISIDGHHLEVFELPVDDPSDDVRQLCLVVRDANDAPLPGAYVRVTCTGAAGTTEDVAAGLTDEHGMLLLGPVHPELAGGFQVFVDPPGAAQ